MHEKSLKFPCDCVSGNAECEESWVKVAKDGMFKDGTKEIIINRLHKQPLTIAQFAKEIDLAQPTVFRHMSDLSKNGIIREKSGVEKGYTAEKYYELNFPVITSEDKKRFEPEIEELAEALADKIRSSLDGMKAEFSDTGTSQKGWRFEEISQYIVFSAQRKARKQMEKEGRLATELQSSGLDYMFWAEET